MADVHYIVVSHIVQLGSQVFLSMIGIMLVVQLLRL